MVRKFGEDVLRLRRTVEDQQADHDRAKWDAHDPQDQSDV
jgi:hypothetical protein